MTLADDELAGWVAELGSGPATFDVFDARAPGAHPDDGT